MIDTKISNTQELEDLIKSELGVIVYFSTQQCNVCKVLRPKIMAHFSETFPAIKRIFVDLNDAPELAAKFSVFSAPTILVFLDGKEFARESRNISLDIFSSKIQRLYDLMTS